MLRMGKPRILSALSMVPGRSEKLAARRAEYESWLDAFLADGSATPQDASGEPQAAA